uniref:Uncharacterized protein n=1 Tax=Arundo donax TaxID=35708 RepID=A0A0A9B5W4_ARUDO
MDQSIGMHGRHWSWEYEYVILNQWKFIDKSSKPDSPEPGKIVRLCLDLSSLK